MTEVESRPMKTEEGWRGSRSVTKISFARRKKKFPKRVLGIPDSKRGSYYFQAGLRTEKKVSE